MWCYCGCVNDLCGVVINIQIVADETTRLAMENLQARALSVYTWTGDSKSVEWEIKLPYVRAWATATAA